MPERKDFLRFCGSLTAATVAFLHPIEARAQSLDFIDFCMAGTPYLLIIPDVPKNLAYPVAVVVTGTSVDSRVGRYIGSHIEGLPYQTRPLLAQLVPGERYRVELVRAESYNPLTNRIEISERIFSKEIKEAPYCRQPRYSK